MIMDGIVIPQWKRLAYRAGHYSMKVPPVSTYLWREDDWIRWIDASGFWRHCPAFYEQFRNTNEDEINENA